jgi:mannose-1-phosphate guanylyltransferase
MLEIWLALCSAHGISDVLINTHSHADRVNEFVRRQNSGIRIKMVEEQELFGSAGTLRANREWVEDERVFWVFYADVLTQAELRTMASFHHDGDAATLGVYEVPDPERCGIVSLSANSIIESFVEKPAAPASRLAFSGIMIGTPEFLDAIPAKPGADIAFDVLPRLVGRMRAYPIPEFVLDIGTLENYELAQKTWPGLAGVRAC